MKRYKLLRDLPTFKAGDEFFINKVGNLIAGTPEKPRENMLGDGDFIAIYPTKLVAYSKATLDKFPNILTDWFEEIKESNVNWKPKKDEKYWYIDSEGAVYLDKQKGDCINQKHWDIGNVYRTEAEAEHARKLQIARAKIRRSSNFVPDWDDGSQPKYYVCYNHESRNLLIDFRTIFDYGAITYYATEDDIKQAIKELESEYLMHFGVEK